MQMINLLLIFSKVLHVLACGGEIANNISYVHYVDIPYKTDCIVDWLTGWLAKAQDWGWLIKKFVDIACGTLT